jgi:hypothetical protein
LHTTHKVKTQQVAKNRGQWCGDIEIATYLSNSVGPVPLVLHLRIVHKCWGSRSNPSLHGHLYYPLPPDIGRTLNEDVTDKTRIYRVDYNNSPSNTISFMSSVTRSSDHLHCELVLILFWRIIGSRFFLIQEFSLHNPTSSKYWYCFYNF